MFIYHDSKGEIQNQTEIWKDEDTDCVSQYKTICAANHVTPIDCYEVFAHKIYRTWK